MDHHYTISFGTKGHDLGSLEVQAVLGSFVFEPLPMSQASAVPVAKGAAAAEAAAARLLDCRPPESLALGLMIWGHWGGPYHRASHPIGLQVFK